MNNQTTVTVLGAGYVGLTTAALLAHSGFKVYAIEPNLDRLDIIKQGRSFFFEEGLDPVIKSAIEAGNLIPTDSYEDSVPHSSIIFSCVGTPDNPDGSSNLTYVFSAAEHAVKLAQDGSIYIQKSTVPVGTGEKIEKLFASLGKNIYYVSNPEFLREGTALSDTLYFDRVVAGGNNHDAVKTVLDVYRRLEEHRDVIADIAHIDKQTQTGDYISTSRNSAELIKVTANAFLAMKISFANSIAKLSDQAGADITEVMAAVGADKRIGRAFLNAGRGYGGGCFPKDVSGLIASGLEYGVDLDIMRSAQAVNESMPGYITEKLKEVLGGSISGVKISVLGLSFKAGTSDTRRSPGVIIANLLQKEGAIVCAYDPQANHEATNDLNQEIFLAESLEICVKDANALLIATEWPEFINKPAHDYADIMQGKVFVDAINRFNPSDIKAVNLQYIGVGR